MSSISMLPGFLKNSSWRWPFQNQASRESRRGTHGDAQAAAASSALTRSLLQNAQAGAAIGPPADAHLGNLIDLRATMVTRTEDASLTIKTAEGDTVTLSTHSQLQSLKARLTYGPGDAPGHAPATTAAGTNGAATAPAEHDGDEDDGKGVTQVRLREIQLDQSITLSVQGDLSDQELADIKKLVAGLGDALKGSGEQHGEHDPGDAEHAQASSLTRIDTQGLGSLAGFELHVERSVEVTKIRVRRAPANPAPATAQDPAPAPDAAPGAEPPIASEPPVVAAPGARPAPGTAKAPVLGKSSPVTPGKPDDPAWIIKIMHSKRTSVADLLFRRSIRVPQSMPEPGAPLPESPAATR